MRSDKDASDSFLNFESERHNNPIRIRMMLISSPASLLITDKYFLSK